MTMMVKTKLVDVAKAAGVSVAAASVALNKSKVATIRVAPEKAEYICKVAREMGYTPNISAKLLAGKSARILGVVMDSHAVPSAHEVLCAISETAFANGYQVMVSEVHNSIDGIESAYQSLLRYGADGVIFLAYDYPGQRELFLEKFSGVQKVVVLNPIAGTELIGPSIGIEAALDEALSVLHEKGRSRIGGIFPGSMVWDIEHRRLVLERLCRKRGFAALEFLALDFAQDRNAIAVQMEQCVMAFLRSHKIDAVFITNDIYAAFLNRALLRAGLRVPEDVAVIGWDNCSFGETLTPALSSVDSDTGQQGRLAVELLLKQLKGVAIRPEETVIQSRFILRDSV